MHKLDYDLNYLILSLDLSSTVFGFPFTKEMLFDQFHYIYMTSEVKIASA